MGVGAHPFLALAWALLGRPLLFWPGASSSLLSKEVTPFRHTGETHLLLKRQLRHRKGCQELGAYLSLLGN